MVGIGGTGGNRLMVGIGGTGGNRLMVGMGALVEIDGW